MESKWDCKEDAKSGSQTDSEKIWSDMLQLGLKNWTDMMGLMGNLATAAMKPGASKSKDCGCHDAPGWLDCAPCGPKTATTDLKLDTRLGEHRRLTLLIENNRKVESSFTVKVTKLIDACGQELKVPDGTANVNLINFSPMEGVIQPDACQRVDVLVNLAPPFQGGQVYYAEIQLEGSCCAREVSLGIWVQPDNLADQLMLCDPCRPKKGKRVEFNRCNCGNCPDNRNYYIC